MWPPFLLHLRSDKRALLQLVPTAPEPRASAHRTTARVCVWPPFRLLRVNERARPLSQCPRHQSRDLRMASAPASAGCRASAPHGPVPSELDPGSAGGLRPCSCGLRAGLPPLRLRLRARGVPHCRMALVVSPRCLALARGAPASCWLLAAATQAASHHRHPPPSSRPLHTRRPRFRPPAGGSPPPAWLRLMRSCAIRVGFPAPVRRGHGGDHWSRPPLPACRSQRRCGVRRPAGGSPPPAWLPKRGYESRINHSFPAPVWRGHGDGPLVPPSQTSAKSAA